MKLLDHLEEWLISFLMAAATVIIFLSVLHRYLAATPIPGVLPGEATAEDQEGCRLGHDHALRPARHVAITATTQRSKTSARAAEPTLGPVAGAKHITGGCRSRRQPLLRQKQREAAEVQQPQQVYAL